jgi:hypothetical protein
MFARLRRTFQNNLVVNWIIFLKKVDFPEKVWNRFNQSFDDNKKKIETLNHPIFVRLVLMFSQMFHQTINFKFTKKDNGQKL